MQGLFAEIRNYFFTRTGPRTTTVSRSLMYLRVIASVVCPPSACGSNPCRLASVNDFARRSCRFASSTPARDGQLDRIGIRYDAQSGGE
jgi:hypothetical protein